MTECSCYRCTIALVEREPLPASEKLFGTVDPRVSRMFLCEICGNKRCPHAADHNLACTGSNEPGQRGSLYEDAPTFQNSRKDGSSHKNTQPSQGEEP